MDNSKVKFAVVAGVVVAASGLFWLRRRAKKSRRFLAISIGGTHARLCILQKNEHINSFTLLSNIFDIETKSPAEFLQFVRATFKPEDFEAVTIASFGPLSLHKGETYGQVIVAPSEQKKPWEKFSLAAALAEVFSKPAHVETDVNSAAVAEYRLGGHGNIQSIAYITIGTGVGVGLVIGGKTVHGFLHPEGGHMV
jgi:fructokinase